LFVCVYEYECVCVCVGGQREVTVERKEKHFLEQNWNIPQLHSM